MAPLPEKVSAIILQAGDLRWQKLRELIEEYGRECYDEGAQKLLDTLSAAAATEEYQHDRADVALIDLARNVLSDGSPESARPPVCVCDDPDCPAKGAPFSCGCDEEYSGACGCDRAMSRPQSCT